MRPPWQTRWPFTMSAVTRIDMRAAPGFTSSSRMPSKREARVFFGFHDGMLIALHAIFKKTQKTPAGELALAKQRLKEVQSWR